MPEFVRRPGIDHDLGIPQPATEEEYRKAALLIAGWAADRGVVDELPTLLEMIGFPDGR